MLKTVHTLLCWELYYVHICTLYLDICGGHCVHYSLLGTVLCTQLYTLPWYMRRTLCTLFSVGESTMYTTVHYTLMYAEDTVYTILCWGLYLTQTTLLGWPSRDPISSPRHRSQTLIESVKQIRLVVSHRNQYFGSGSTSGNVDLDPGTKKIVINSHTNKLKVTKKIIMSTIYRKKLRRTKLEFFPDPLTRKRIRIRIKIKRIRNTARNKLEMGV